MIDEERAKGTPVLVFDSGDLVARDGRMHDGARPAKEAKGDLILRAVAKTGIDAMTIGDGDLALGLEWYQSLAQELELPVVVANLTDPAGTAPFPATRVIELEGMKVGVFGITGNLSESDEYVVTDAVEAATAAVAELQEEGCHLIVALSHQGVDDDVALAEAVPGIDFVFTAHTRRRMEFPRVAGPAPTYVMQAGSRGRNVGRVAITFVEGGRGFHDPALADQAHKRKESVDTRLADLEQQLLEAENERDKQRVERSLERTRANAAEMAVADVGAEGKHTMAVDTVALGKNVADQAEIAQMVAEAKSTMPEEPRHKGRAGGPGRAKMGELAGSSACRRCHPQAYQQWRQSGHSNAYTTLVREQKHDSEECFGCHITGFFAEGGPRKPSEVSYLRNVQCESCHGPSAKHVADVEVATPNKGKEKDTCANCHNDKAHAGQAPAFDLTAALAKVQCEDTPVDPAAAGRAGRPPRAGAPQLAAPLDTRAVKPAQD